MFVACAVRVHPIIQGQFSLLLVSSEQTHPMHINFIEEYTNVTWDLVE